MDGQRVFQLTFDCGTSKRVVVEPSAAQVSSDAGLLPFRQLDERLGLTQQLAACLTDRRHVAYVDHTLLEMVRMRVSGPISYPSSGQRGLTNPKRQRGNMCFFLADASG
ncbi:MAG: transposase [Pirellulales bacterium]|nr:transposase [Pirellulales bacterium]